MGVETLFKADEQPVGVGQPRVSAFHGPLVTSERVDTNIILTHMPTSD
jgi:hypothetical protein